jgi:PHD/YefM family antitoxin component YafN of YafNO toxin-antitoxin module
MRTVAQSEAIATLPALLDEVEQQPVVISRGGEQVAALVSMKNFEAMRRLNWERMDQISREAGARLDARAAELGISPEQLAKAAASRRWLGRNASSSTATLSLAE